MRVHVRRWKLWPLVLRECPKNYINLERISTQSERSRKSEKFHRKQHHSSFVDFCRLQLALTLTMRIFQVMKKKRKRSRLDFCTSFTLFFLVYNNDNGVVLHIPQSSRTGAPGLVLHRQQQFRGKTSSPQRLFTRWGERFYPSLQRCSQCNLQQLLTGYSRNYAVMRKNLYFLQHFVSLKRF